MTAHVNENAIKVLHGNVAGHVLLPKTPAITYYLPSIGRSVLPGTAAVNGRMPGLPGMLNLVTTSYLPET